MKAAIVFALAVTASAVAPTLQNCGIPTEYATAASNVCTGPAAGYKLWGVCLGGTDQTVIPQTAGGARVEMTATNAGTVFTSGGLAPANSYGSTNCAVPNPRYYWGDTTAAFNTLSATNAALTTDDACTGLTAEGSFPIADLSTTVVVDNANQPMFSATKGYWKGIEIRCDTASNYYPAQGYQGTNICMSGWETSTATANLPVYPAVNAGGAAPADMATQAGRNSYWMSSPFQSLDTTAAQFQNAHIPQFSGTNALQCAAACPVTAGCDATTGLWHPNVLAGGSGYLGNCLMRPSHPDWPTSLSLQCQTGGANGPSWTVTCVAGTAPATTSTLGVNPTYADECGGLNGGSTNVRFNFDGELDNYPVVGTNIEQAAGEISDPFSGVTSVFSLAYTAATAQSTIWTGRRDWNANPNQVFQQGAAYKIVPTGCETLEPVLRSQCVQHVLNWWRCKYDVDFVGGACYAGGVLTPCPTHELGFRCPTSSKKGLLGLLGLLAIPLLCLCCLPLLFLLCCRKKKNPEPEFATFTPMMAPTACAVPFAQPVATGFAPAACTAGFAPSAVPML